MAPGFLIALEGVDGSGKSTQGRLLAAALTKAGHEVILTEEPTAGPVGQKIRAYLKGPVRNLSPLEELHLFIADRREHVEQVIGPGLAGGKVVICDRYYYSSAAYQGALGLDPDEIVAENESFAPRPDLVFLLTLPVPQALERLMQKGPQAAQLTESLNYLRQVAAIYAGLEGPHIRRVETSLVTPEVAHELILWETLEAMKSRRPEG